MFFTLWGLNIIKKNKDTIESKRLMKKMLNLMYWGGSIRLKLSRFSIFGLVTRMMKKLIKDTNMPSVDKYIAMVRDARVNLIGCTTTCGVMGIASNEETFSSDASVLSGATHFLNLSRQSKVVLFI